MRKYKRLEEKAKQVSLILTEKYPESECALKYEGDPWRLLVMARLSAQCTDARVNIVSVPLFEAFPSAEAMAEGAIEDIEKIIKPCGLYHSKAKNIKDASALICEKYDGKIPDTMDSLLELPGVGRKIANLLMGDIFNMGGIVADTHCIRICGRLGFYPESKKDPLCTERTMEQYVEKSSQSDFCHRLVMFGRDVCLARSPLCGECPLSSFCDKYSRDSKK